VMTSLVKNTMKLLMWKWKAARRFDGMMVDYLHFINLPQTNCKQVLWFVFIQAQEHIRYNLPPCTVLNLYFFSSQSE
jgi:hypothetical protein